MNVYNVNQSERKVHRLCFRVGHLILRALAIRASNPQNALARISCHSLLIPTEIYFNTENLLTTRFAGSFFSGCKLPLWHNCATHCTLLVI